MYATGLARMLYHEVASEKLSSHGSIKYKALCGSWFWPHFTRETLDGVESYGCQSCEILRLKAIIRDQT
jgi:hypothetical protein